MNNIEILEEFLEQYNASYPEEKEWVAIYPNQIEAIENLLENSKKIIELNIPKSKVKEKIEEYDKMIKATYGDMTVSGKYRRDVCLEIKQNLQELLGKENNMSEEIAIDTLSRLIDRCKECKFATCENCEISWNEVQSIKGLLDLYTHKKGRVEELKQELLQEKEKNKALKEGLKYRINYCKLLEKELYTNGVNYKFEETEIEKQFLEE